MTTGTYIKIAALCISISACATFSDKPPPISDLTKLDSIDFDNLDYSSFQHRRELAAERLRLNNIPESFYDNLDPTLPIAKIRQSIIDDKDLKKAIKVELERLLAVWPGNHPKLDVIVTEDTQYGAETSPGGTINISLGVLKEATSLDEFNFVLAHEMSHALLNHFNTDELINEQQRASALLLGGAVLLDQLASKKRRESAEQGNPELGTGGKIALAAGSIVLVNNENRRHQWQRREEIEADRLALDLLLRRGLSQSGAINSLERLVSTNKEIKRLRGMACGQKKTFMHSLLTKALNKNTTNRSSSNRQIKQANKFWASTNSTRPSTKKAQLNQAEITAISNIDCDDDPNAAFVGLFLDQRTHPEAEVRLQNLQLYYDRHYETRSITALTKPKENETVITLLSPKGPVIRSLKANDAQAALNSGAIDEALKIAYSALDGANDATPLLRDIMFQIRMKQYETTQNSSFREKAMTNLEISVGQDRAYSKHYQILASMQEEDGNVDKAIATLKKAINRFGPTKANINELFRLYYLESGEIGLKNALAHCNNLWFRIYESLCIPSAKALLSTEESNV
ncbi:MAG: hypothetical protein Tsb002_11930 [Wenzhouxiangellaceae bacterium]